MALRAAVVGLGEMGRHHARAINDMNGVELVAIVDPREVGHLHYGVAVAGHLEEIDSLDVDFAVVAVPTVDHLSTGRRLALLGVNTLIEKPLAHDVEACKSLWEAFESRHLVAGVGHIERYNPAVLAMRERIQRGELGEIYQIVTRRQGPYPSRIKDVGVVMDLATHDLDIATWVLDSAYSQVAAHSSHRSGGGHEDMVAILGHMRGGVIANHLVNWLSPLKERTVVVTGSLGCMVADTLSGDLTYYKNGVAPVEWEAVAAFRGVIQGDVVRFALAKREPLLVELEAFRDAVLGKSCDVVSLRDGTEAVTVAQGVLSSLSRGGATVRLDAGSEDATARV